MFFTGKGDDGSTGFFGSAKRAEKDSTRAETLGSLDEINSLLGVCKVKALDANLRVEGEEKSVGEMVNALQQNLFVVQAELAGASKRLGPSKIKEVERYIVSIEETLPPITSFFVSGGTELAATFDFARTVARRVERQVVKASKEFDISDNAKQFMNRLSSILYAMARHTNHVSGITEEPPSYE